MPTIDDISQQLTNFKVQHSFVGVGSMGTALILTQKAIQNGMPLDLNSLVTGGGGQVAGLSGRNINRLLEEHGVHHRVGTEAGRTSRGTPALARLYACFLNDLSPDQQLLQDMKVWWIDEFVKFFSSQPFKLTLDSSRSLMFALEDLLHQATSRQRKNPGSTYTGTMLQHLIGATLELSLPEQPIKHHGVSVADAVSSRSGDFVFEGITIHCTMTPGEALLAKCIENINNGVAPTIFTVSKGVVSAQNLLESHAIDGRVCVIDALQFIAMKIYEFSNFDTSKIHGSLIILIKRYNDLISLHETNPSLKILFE